MLNTVLVVHKITWSFLFPTTMSLLTLSGLVERTVLLFHVSKVSASNPGPWTSYPNWGFPLSFSSYKQKPNKRHEQFILPMMLAHVLTLLADILEVPGSNLGDKTDYAECFSGFTKSLRESSRIVPWIRPGLFPSMSFSVHCSHHLIILCHILRTAL
jgi:hypothetical protein